MTAAARSETHGDAMAMPHWPRLMSVVLAARYCGVSATYLRENGPRPKNAGRRVLYDIHDLNRWADSLSGLPLDQAQKKAEGDDMLARVRGRLSNGQN